MKSKIQLLALAVGLVLYADAATTPDLFTPHLSSKAKTVALEQTLSWVPDTRGHASVCGGHYFEPELQSSGPDIPLKQAPSNISYDEATYQLKGTAHFQNIHITQPNRSLYADEATLSPLPGTEHLNQIEAQGHVRLTQPGMLMVGQQGATTLSEHQAYLDNVYYLLKVPSNWEAGPSYTDPNFTGYAHGHADIIKQTSAQIFVLHNTNYSTCPPNTATWQMSASKITLNQTTGEGTAENTVLRIHHIPVMYLPYFDFPLNKARKSGFLFGSIGHSSESGMALTIPYYFNLMPEIDDTLSTTIYSQRGVVFDNQFRYLNPLGSGSFESTIIPHDTQMGQARGAFQWENFSQWGSHWQSTVDYHYITDDQVLQDFGNNANAISANQVLLNRSVNLSYTDPHASFFGLAQYYQVINPELSVENRPYNRLPEIDFSLNYPGIDQFVNLSMNNQFVNFQKNIDGVGTPVNSQRLNLDPEISLPIYQSFGFFIPSMQLDSALYSLGSQLGNLDPSNPVVYPHQTLTRTLPIYTIDTGLYFDRTFFLQNRPYTQTLEPELFYTYVPYQNQDDIPIFDTSLSNFSFSSLTQTNIFNGLDRISNANQLSFILKTDIHNPEGVDKLNAGIGQIVYFTPPKVSMCSDTTSNCLTTGQMAIYNQPHSDLAGFTNYYFDPYWNISGNWLYNSFKDGLDLQGYQLQYRLDNRHIFNLGYQYNANDFALLSTEQMTAGEDPPALSQIMTSGIWPLTHTLSAIAQWNYSLNSRNTINVFEGLEYSGCCWAMRFIFQRYVTDTNPNTPNIISGPMTSAFVVQFELKGLGSTDSSQVDSIESSIPGFQTQN